MPMSRSRAVPVAVRRGPLVLAPSTPPMVEPGTVSSSASRWPPVADRALHVGEQRARLGRDDEVAGGVVEHPVERREVEQHVGAGGGGAPRELGAASAGHDREAVGRAGPHHLGHLVGVGGPGHEPGRDAVDGVVLLGVVDLRTGGGERLACGGVEGVRRHQKTSARPASCSGWAPLCRPGTSPHSRGVGNTLPGLEMFCGVEGAAHQLHGVQVLVGEHARHVLRLVHADAVLAGDRAAVLDAEVEDGAADALGRLAGTLDLVVEEHQRVQVAVAGVEDVGHPHARRRRRARRWR